MAKRTFLAGVTSQTIDVFLQDSSSTVGAGLAGLTNATSGLTAYYRKGATGTPTAISLASQTVGGAWTSGGFVETDATHMKGVYRFDVPDTILAATPYAIIYFYGAANLAPNVSELEIVAYNPFDTVRLGLTALPNAAAAASGGLYTRGTGAGQINQSANGQIDVNIDTIKTNPVVNAGTVTFPTTATLASTTNITAGTITTATTAVNLTTNNDKTGYSLVSPQTLNITGNITGNISGSVGSVTGLTASNLDTTVSSRLATAGYTAPDNSGITSIKTQTDKLAFTVANQVDSNIQYVNDIQVDGTGTTLDPWGPV